jgi:isopentenyl-diphosphate delta-isomerase
MSAGEIINVFNENGEVIDTISRGQAEQEGGYLTENVLVFAFNSLGKVWSQLRPMNKNSSPGKWDISVCGGVSSEETHEQAALRETFEETGIEMGLHYTGSFLNVFPGDNGIERRRLSHVYVGTTDEIPQVNEEVDEFKDWQPDELREDAVNNPDKYVPSFIAEYDRGIAGYQNLQSK